MHDLPDAVLAAAVTALFAQGTTHIRNVGNLRIKESDRLAALETELRKLGADAHAGPDSIAITPRALHGAQIATYDDHRMAMAFSLAGLRVPGVTIEDPACVSKSWPQYFDALRVLC
jgi:3-phosphoshikimate 1-carboxyvinyltransferase